MLRKEADKFKRHPQDNATAAVEHLSAAFRLHTSALDLVAKVAIKLDNIGLDKPLGSTDVFDGPPVVSGGLEAPRDPQSKREKDQPFRSRRLGSAQLEAVSVSNLKSPWLSCAGMFTCAPV
jgi:hypothetical protein